MLNIAHRGLINDENRINSIIEAAQYNDIVECDIRYNTSRQVVLCHDRENRNNDNELFEILCNKTNPINLMIDIKAFGIKEAERLASDIMKIINNTCHTYYLCSFNEFCINKIHNIIVNENINANVKIGLITSGISTDFYQHINCDFISMNYDVIADDIVRELHMRNKKVFAWVVNDESIKKKLISYNIDGIIYDM